MSVFHKMYLGSMCEFNQLKKLIFEFVSEKNVKTVDTIDELTISSEGLTIFVKEGGHSVTFRSEDYGLSFRFDFYIDINSSCSNWSEELMGFTGMILKNFEGDFVLEANADTAYLMRKKSDNIVIADDSRLGYFPFEFLGIEYKKEILKQV